MGCGTEDPPAPARNTQATATATATAAPTSTAHPIGDDLSALCRDWNVKGDKLNARFEQHANAGEWAAAAESLRAGLKVAAVFDRKVAALDPPADQRAAFERYTGTLRRLRALTVELADEVEVGNVEALGDLRTRFDQVRQARLEAALDLGADDCGS